MSKEPPFFLSGMNDAVLSKFAGVLGGQGVEAESFVLGGEQDGEGRG